LPEPERRFLCCLAIFSGGFTLAAAAAVMHDFGRDPSVVTDSIANLVAKSLVALDRPETEARWYLLETTRVYALEKLSESGATGEIARRHAEYWLALFAPFAAEGRLQSAIDDLGLYRREIDNVRAALTWALAADGDAAVGVALAATTADFWSATSLDAEACAWAAKAVARIGNETGTRREMVLQFTLGMTLIHTKGMIGAAREALTRALMLAREHADIDYQQRATNGLWLFSFRMAAFNDALATSRQYDADTRLQDPHSQAVADWLVGIPLIYLGEHLEASTRLQRAIDRYPIERRDLDTVRFGGDVRASASGHIAVSLLSLGRLGAASQAAVRAVDEARARDQPAVLCVALAWAAGFIFLSLGELDLAERYGEELIAHADKHALRPIHATGLCVRGSLAARRADPGTGIDLLRRGLAGMREASYLLFYPFFLVELAWALGGVGRINDGLTEIDTALRFAVETGHRWYVPEITRVKGELLALRGSGDPAAVEDLYRESMSLAHEQHALYWELSTAISLAELLRDQHRETEARAVLNPIQDRFSEGFSAMKLQRAKMLLRQLL
jgi:non-specific serine/threonine protein kinase